MLLKMLEGIYNNQVHKDSTPADTVIVVWNGETRIIISVLFSSPKCRILALLALQLQWTGGWFERQCLPFDPAAALGSASGKLHEDKLLELLGFGVDLHLLVEDHCLFRVLYNLGKQYSSWALGCE
ncbi:uncharacterized protein LOC124674534 [Lolium rigidum]|uniref:uncharacterized protein LOC124674534 n=1 Tax=Lolium rigidum TaxID=89674 RepID=UPI001F5C4215|nr:uncharacterized protein LOC124674534 [Lolium rigidum]